MIFDRVFLKFILVGLINTLAGSALMFLLYNIAGLGLLGFFRRELYRRKRVGFFLSYRKS
jgi:hypothetical protein